MLVVLCPLLEAADIINGLAAPKESKFVPSPTDTVCKTFTDF